jgi:hypothetical protein
MFNKINKKIIGILEIDELPIDQQKRAMEELGPIVYQEIMVRVLDKMNEEDRKGFEELIAKDPDPETMFAYLSEKVPDVEQIAEEEAEKLQKEIVNETETI